MISTNLNDTIIIFVRDTIPHQDMIEAYQTLLQSQQSSYNYLLIGIALLFTLLVASIVYFSAIRTKTQIKELTQEIFNEEKKNIISEISEGYDKRFNKLEKESNTRFYLMEGNSARLFGSFIDDTSSGSDIAHSVGWYLLALRDYIGGDVQRQMIRPVLHAIIEKLKIIDSGLLGIKQEFINEHRKQIAIGSDSYSYDFIIKNISIIPDYFAEERNLIYSVFASIKDELTKAPEEDKPKPKKSDKKK